MVDPQFRAEWRPRTMRARRFYASYMKWVVRGGYTFTLLGLIALGWAFVERRDVTISTQGGDTGVIAPSSSALVAPQTGRIAKVMVPSGATVSPGTTLISFGDDTGLIAEAGGVVRWSSLAKEGETVRQGETLGRVVDYRSLTVSATVRGDQTPKADLGQLVTLSRIEAETASTVLLRVRGGDQGWVSKEPGAAELLAASEAALKGMEFGLRNDRNMTVESIASLEVELDGAAAAATGPTLSAIPDRELRIAAKVDEGVHRAKVQFSKVSPELRERLQGLLSSTVGGKSLVQADGSKGFSIGATSGLSTIVQAQLSSPAGSPAPASGQEASVLERSFELKSRLTDPPAWLVELVKEADARDKKVRAFVEVRVGTTTVALQLLRR